MGVVDLADTSTPGRHLAGARAQIVAEPGHHEAEALHRRLLLANERETSDWLKLTLEGAGERTRWLCPLRCRYRRMDAGPDAGSVRGDQRLMIAVLAQQLGHRRLTPDRKSVV